MVSISKTNKKMGGIPSISFPPVITCAHCEDCAKICYARRMANFHKTVGEAWAHNLEEWRTNPTAVKYAIINAAITSAYFRYFVGGDIPDGDFLRLMVEIAQTVPTCKFLAFTKKYELVNEFINGGGIIPDNLKIIFSEWRESIPNPYNLPTSRVIFKGEEEPHGAMVCGGNCAECICKGIACWTLKNGESIYFYQH